MLQHNLVIIFRGFLRFKSSFITNLIGLSAGLASTMLIYLWVSDELTFDKYHEKGDRIFQVMEHQQQDGVIKTSGQTTDFLSTALAEEMPEIELATVVTPPNFFPSFTLSATDRDAKGVGKFADKDFFNIFSYPLIHGNPDQALASTTNIVISESLAKKLFVTPQNCIGKSLEWKMMDLKKEVIISGVFSDLPDNSSERFDFVMSFDSFRNLIGIKDGDINWDNAAPFLTYIVVKEGTNVSQLNAKMGSLLGSKSENSRHRTLFIKSYADNYLHGHYENGVEAGGRIEYVILFSTIAAFILLIACINFTNLVTAQALRKLKETGIKRVIGAQQKTLVLQYLLEAFVMTFLSLLIAVLMVNLVMPLFNEVAGKNLELVFNTEVIVALTVLVILTTLLAGSYPAFYLSSFDPGRVLSGHFNSSAGKLWARKGLVVFQFALSVIFIVLVMVVYKQIDFIQTKNLGYEKENVIYFEAEGKASQNPEMIIAKLNEIPGVLKASSMLGNIVSKTDGGGMPGTVEWNERKVTMNNSAVNYGLIELLGMEMKEGRVFSRDFTSDKDKIIYNEAAIEALGIDSPVGKIVGGSEILGVVKDFHYQSLHEPVKPYCFRLESQSASTIMIKVQPGTEKQTIDELQKIYTAYNPGFVFNYEFLDKDFQEQYVAEKRVSVLSQYATGLTILISSLGLFGLAAFTTERRGREIGIRKVLGSSEMGVVLLLSREFMKMVIISIFIALPISYWIAISWLDKFAYRIDLEWWYFLGAACVTLLISWLTVGMHTIKAAKSNPATILRSE